MTTSSDPTRELVEVEVLEDRAAHSGPTEGFLKLRRLRVRNRYRDGGSSEPYPCDIVSRAEVDAVTVVLFERREDDRVRVGLRENLRVPIWLRRRSPDVLFPDEPRHDTLLETVAGVLEATDAGQGLGAALKRRVVEECREEVGLAVTPDAVRILGAAAFPSPGITDEKVYFCAAAVDLDAAGPPAGDGSAMEEVGGLVVLTLDEALRLCRDGGIPDMKTEIALRRLAESLDG